MSESIVLYRCHGNSVASTALGMDYQCRDCGGMMKEDGVWYRDSEITRLTRERDDLRNELARLTNRFETFGRHIELSRLDRTAIERAREFLANADKETGE